MPRLPLVVPRRAHIERVDESDPLPYYYLPLIGLLFRQRLNLALELLGQRRFDRVLEAGYGSGILLPTLARQARDVHGVDLHRRPDLAMRMLAMEGVPAHLTMGSVTNLGYAEHSFDAVVCLSTLEHLHDEALRSALNEMHRVLRPDGVAVIGVPSSGRLMDALFALIGFSEIGEHHVSTRDEIQSELRRAFVVDGEARMPAGAPDLATLYTVYRCRRR